MRTLLLILTASCLLAETGGLQSLPFPKGTEILRSTNMVANGNFNGDSIWAKGSGVTYDAAVTRTADGSGSYVATNIGTSYIVTSQAITQATYGTNRVFRINAYLRASADPGSTATFRIYIWTRGSPYRCGQPTSASDGNLSGLGSEWKSINEDIYDIAGEACYLLHHREPHLDQDISFRFEFANIPNGVNVWVDDVQLVPVVRPLVVYPTYPNYRGMLWPDQGTTIKWNSVVDVPEGETIGGLTARVQVVRASDQQVMATVTDSSLEAVRTTGRWSGYSINPQEYDASGLSDGPYYLRGTLRRTSGDVQLYQYPDYKIVKEQPSVQRNAWKVWVDQHNRIVLNGKPRFIHGTYASFTASQNTFPSGASAITTDPDAIRKMANGCIYTGADGQGATCNESIPAPTPWNRSYGLTGSTWLKQLADVKINSTIVFASYGTLTQGLSPTSGPAPTATGTITSSGTTVTGSGTLFGTEVLGPANANEFGDVISPLRNGTGTITSQGGVSSKFITGSGTSFTTQVSPGDLIRGGAVADYVESVLDDTTLTIDEPRTQASGTSFTVEQLRKVTAVNSSTSLTVSAPFQPDISSGQSFLYDACATGGGRYVSADDQLGAYITALRDYDIWHWQLSAGMVGAGAPFWGNVNHSVRCHLVTAADQIKWWYRFRPLGTTDGFAGFYPADESTYFSADEGLEITFESHKSASEQNFGGVNFWADGVAPSFPFDQWNQVVDAWGPDPYPNTGITNTTVDDVGFGLDFWDKHGRTFAWTRRDSAAAFDSRPILTIIQLFRWFATGGLTYSTYPQLSGSKIQIGQSLAGGATGIFWWHTAATLGSLGLRKQEAYLAWRRTAKLIADYMPILEQPVQDFPEREDGEADYGRIIASVSNASIKCSSRQRGDQILVACANTTNTDITATIQMVNTIPGRVYLPWDGSTIVPSGSAFTYTFKGVNGGTQTAGTGTVTSSGTTLTCATTCNFEGEIKGVPYAFPSVVVNGNHRMVVAVPTATTATLDDDLTEASAVSFTYSTDAEKQKAAEIFIIEQPAGSRTRTASN